MTVCQSMAWWMCSLLCMCRLQWDTQRTRNHQSTRKIGIKKHDLSFSTKQDDSQTAFKKKKKSQNLNELNNMYCTVKGIHSISAFGLWIFVKELSWGHLSPLCLLRASKPDIYPNIKQRQCRQGCISFTGAHCHHRGGSTLGAGWVNRCEGVSTKAHLFSVYWTKRLRARWIEGPWGGGGASSSSAAWLLNFLTMVCLKASGKWSFHLLYGEHVMNGAAAADAALETSTQVLYFTQL